MHDYTSFQFELLRELGEDLDQVLLKRGIKRSIGRLQAVEGVAPGAHLEEGVGVNAYFESLKGGELLGVLGELLQKRSV